MDNKETVIESRKSSLNSFSRRNFLGLTGGLLAAGVLLDSCNRDDDGPGGVVLAANDLGVLNYAYALEQLEAAFYTEVIKRGFYNNIPANEKLRLTEIRDHEVAHREFFKTAIGTKAIPALTFDFSTVDFGSRDSVLQTARTMEDLGVSAYNGAGQLLKDVQYLLLAGKIVSVEARHAAYIRELLAPGSFAAPFSGLDYQFDSSNGLEISKSPDVVLAAASTFIKTPIVNNLPLS